jgi:hypothetical protein
MRPLFEVLWADNSSRHGKAAKRTLEIMFLSVIEFCRDDGAAAAPMNKSSVFLVLMKKENEWFGTAKLGWH